MRPGTLGELGPPSVSPEDHGHPQPPSLTKTFLPQAAALGLLGAGQQLPWVISETRGETREQGEAHPSSERRDQEPLYPSSLPGPAGEKLF